MMSHQEARDSAMHGSAYDLAVPTYDRDLVLVDRGSDSGELLRRYWHPIALASDIKDLPVAVRVLGEDLILFRTAAGRFGLVYPRCAHRGTSLLYGRPEQRGIRCCHHGWLFSPEGRCLEQPCEPDGGRKLEAYGQPWYPVEERYGLVFAYLGPMARKPPLPRFDIFEDLGTHSRIVPVADEMTPVGPATLPCNWFQTWESTADPYHVSYLHREQFSPLIAAQPREVKYEYTPQGVCTTTSTRHNGRMMWATTEVMLPTIAIVPQCIASAIAEAPVVAWITPIDNTTNRAFVVVRISDRPLPVAGESPCSLGGKSWPELEREDHQRYPTDYEAQVSQGPITFHSEEHLVSSDRGISMVRRLFRSAVRAVREGQDAPNAFERITKVRASGKVMTDP